MSKAEKSEYDMIVAHLRVKPDSVLSNVYCGISCPLEWEPIVGPLFQTLESIRLQSRSRPDPKYRWRAVFFNRVWKHIHNPLIVLAHDKELDGLHNVVKWIYKKIFRNGNWYELYKPNEGLRVAQVKEKFGTLRIYIDGAGDEEAYGAIRLAERLVYNIDRTNGIDRVY
jgi:hypothetical protein